MPTLQDYEKKTKGAKCRWCGEELGAIESYDHSGGWLVEGYEKRQWLYRVCPKCRYMWSLEKLGITRDAGAFK
jgi:ribosomal protein L34E